MHKVSFALIGTILAIILALLTAWWYFGPKGESSTENIQADVITYSTDRPDEGRPGAGYAWRGGDDDPKKIILPGVGVDAYIQNVGVDQNEQIAVPNNIHIAGWFIDSVRPGENGLSIIDGHVDGRTVSDGVFSKLEKLSEGDAVMIEMGDGRTLHYRVRRLTTIVTEDSAGILYSQLPGTVSQLNLITCTGTYLKDQKTYDQRMIVAAELVQ